MLNTVKNGCGIRVDHPPCFFKIPTFSRFFFGRRPQLSSIQSEKGKVYKMSVKLVKSLGETFAVQNYCSSPNVFCISSNQELFVHPSSRALGREASEPFPDLQFTETGRPLQLAQFHVGKGEPRNGIWRRNPSMEITTNHVLTTDGASRKYLFFLSSQLRLSLVCQFSLSSFLFHSPF